MAATLRILVVLLIVGGIVQAIYAFSRSRPQDMPWTELDLAHPVGLFTGRKLAGLRNDGGRCVAMLEAVGDRFTALPPRRDGEQCGYDHAVRIGGDPRYVPQGLGVACPVAAALVLWEREVVQPAALRLLRSRVVRIDHFGSYSCRRIYGRDAGNWSEHATASAVDIAGFRLEDGSRITIVGDWDGTGERAQARARFLRQVRDGACTLFSTVLSPDYNAAHRDHLHLDQAERGALGWRGCR